MIKPEQLKKGDSVAVISPCWGGASIFPHVYESGLEALRSLGLNPVEFPTARMDADKLHNHPELRARDINNAFRDDKIKGIISNIGGSDSVRILRFLDVDTIRANPKFIMGYSDFSTVNTWLNVNGLVTFNGPAVMAGFSQWESFDSDYRAYGENFLFGDPRGEFPRLTSYSEGYPSWGAVENTGKLLPLKTDGGPRIIQGSGKVSGKSFGGCIEVLEMMKGTDFWPQRDFWDGKILFFETSEEKPPVDFVKYWLRNYGVMGVFERISGILFGRPRDYSDEEKAELDKIILSVVKGEFRCGEIPVVTNLPFGHTDPQVIMPLGVEMEIDVTGGKVSLKESPFK